MSSNKITKRPTFLHQQLGRINSSNNSRRKQARPRLTTKATIRTPMQPRPTTRPTRHTPSRTLLRPLTSQTTRTTKRGSKLCQRKDHLQIEGLIPLSHRHERRITQRSTNSSTPNKYQLQARSQTIPDPTPLLHILTPHRHHQRHRSIPSANRPMNALITPLSIMKNIPTPRTGREMQAMTVRDRIRTHRMDSIRETPSLGTCRGATVRELH